MISDIRDDFNGITFSGFKKTVVRKELLNCIYNKKIENSCYWVGELICAGHYSEVWDILICYMSRFIHIGNPKLPIYLFMRFKMFMEILQTGYAQKILEMRNNEKIRNIFCECVCLLCYSRKKHCIEPVKIGKDEFDLTTLSTRLKSPSTEYASAILKPDDPKELFIPMNEMGYCLQTKNTLETCYWIEWILEYETICKKRKIKLLAERRTFFSSTSSNIEIPDKNQKDIIWIIWELIIEYSNHLNNTVIQKTIHSLLGLFLIRYTEGIKRRRRHLLYFAVSICLERVDLSIDIIDGTKSREEITAILSKIERIFAQIKKNEHAPKTDYLFNGLNKTNLDKTIERLNIMTEHSVPNTGID